MRLIFLFAALLIVCPYAARPETAGAQPDRAPPSTATARPTLTPIPGPPSVAHTGTPALSLNPDAGPPGTLVLATGQGFTPGKQVAISYVDAVGPPIKMGSAVAAQDGSIPQFTLVIPRAASSGGTGLILVAGATQDNASSPFAVTPLTHQVSVLPGTAAPGAFVQVSGLGFAPNSSVVILATDASGAPIAQTQPLSTTISGAILPVGITIPAGARDGVATVNAVDAMGHVGGTPLVIANHPESSIALQPTLATPGESVHIEAGGFAPHESVQVFLGDAAGNVTLVANSAQSADARGRLGASFAVPLDDASFGNPPAGRPAGSGGNAGTQLTVILRGTQSARLLRAPLVISGTLLTIVPSSTIAGHPITIIGTGFHAGENVAATAVDHGGAISQLGSAQVSSGGVFSISVAAPLSAGAGKSSFTVTATGEASGLVVVTQLDIVAEQTVTLSSYVLAPGQQTLVRGTYFTPNSVVTVTLVTQWTDAVTGVLLAPLVFRAAADASGAFATEVAIPSHAVPGPVSVSAQDSTGKDAGIDFLVTTQAATVHASAIVAGAGQAITVRGTGFAPHETIELFLAVPSRKPLPLPGSITQTMADDKGDFVAGYIPPVPQSLGATDFKAGAYLLGALGLLSARHGLTAFSIAQAPMGTPTPSTTPGPTNPGTCGQLANTNDLSSYFAGVSTLTISTEAGLIHQQPLLHVVNTSDWPVHVIVAYLLTPLPSGMPTVTRSVAFDVPAHSIRARDVAADIGEGHAASLIVHGTISQCISQSSPRLPCNDASITCGQAIQATLVTHRTLTLSCPRSSGTVQAHGCISPRPPGSHAPLSLQLDASAIAGTDPGNSTTTSPDRGNAAPSTHWYFADGSAGAVYQEYVSLFNPGATPVSAHVVLHSNTQVLKDPMTHVIPPLGTIVLDVGKTYRTLLHCATRPSRGARIQTACIRKLTDPAIGLEVQSSLPLVAQRTLYWGPGVGSAKLGYDASIGVHAGNTSSFFSYASTAGSDHAILALLNPALEVRGCVHPRCDSMVTIHAYSSFGTLVGATTISLAPGLRASVSISRLGGPGVYSLTVRATTPIVAELAQFVGGSPSDGAFPGLELQSSTGATAAIGSGFEPSPQGVLVRVFNPSSGRMIVRVTAMQESGEFFAQGYQIAAHAALSLQLPSLPGKGRSTGGDVKPIAVGVSCSGPCVSAAIEGALHSQGQTVPAFPEAWGATLP